MTDLPASPYQSPQKIGILSALNKYWQMKCGDHALPSRADLDPAEFRYALGNVSLIDVLDDPPRFRFRVIASNIEARFDRALTGTYVDDLPEPEHARLWDKVYRTVCEPANRRPTLGGRSRTGSSACTAPRFGRSPRTIEISTCCCAAASGSNARRSETRIRPRIGANRPPLPAVSPRQTYPIQTREL